MRKDERLTNSLQVKHDCGMHWYVWQRNTKVDYCLIGQVKATLVSTEIKNGLIFGQPSYKNENNKHFRRIS